MIDLRKTLYAAEEGKEDLAKEARSSPRRSPLLKARILRSLRGLRSDLQAFRHFAVMLLILGSTIIKKKMIVMP